MRTGWEIVIAGRNFEPSEFFKTSRIQPNSTWEHEVIDYDSYDNSDAFSTACLPGDHKSREDLILLCESLAKEQSEKAERYLQKGIEFTDFHDGPYPLAMATEALDYLLTNFEEFKKLCAWPGIEERCLTLHDTCAEGWSDFDFTPAQLSALAELKISLTINVAGPIEDKQPEKPTTC